MADPARQLRVRLAKTGVDDQHAQRDDVSWGPLRGGWLGVSLEISARDESFLLVQVRRERRQKALLVLSPNLANAEKARLGSLVVDDGVNGHCQTKFKLALGSLRTRIFFLCWTQLRATTHGHERTPIAAARQHGPTDNYCTRSRNKAGAGDALTDVRQHLGSSARRRGARIPRHTFYEHPPSRSAGRAGPAAGRSFSCRVCGGCVREDSPH
jgi:hypothetical protein